MDIFRVEKYTGFHTTNWDNVCRDRFAYLDDEGGWTTKKAEAVQFSSWSSANACAKNYTGTTVVMSTAIGTKPKNLELKKSATEMARKAAKKLAKKTKTETKPSEGPNKSQQIRDMAATGMKTGEIASALGIRYQFVYKVIKDAETKAGTTTLAASVVIPEDFDPLEDEGVEEEETADVV